MPDKYSKEQVQEIYDIFANDETYSLMVNTFYSGATKKQINEINNLRANILNLCTGLLSTKVRSFDSPELTAAITNFRKNALSDSTNLNIQEKEKKHLIKVAKNLVTIVDNFSEKAFKYRSTNDFASTLVASADNATKLNFKKLTAYSALAKKYLHKEKGKVYTYSKQENDAIAEVFKKGEVPENDLKTICTELGKAYEAVCKVDFVKSTAKTNDLKHGGHRLAQILLGVAGVLGFTALLGSSAIGGVPTDAPTAEAVWNFIGTQIAPWAAAGLITSGGVVTSQRVIASNRARRTREQIKTKVKNKPLFFELLNRTRPKNLQKEERQETSAQKFISLLKTRNVNVNLQDTQFTEKSLTKLLSSTNRKISMAKTAEKKTKHLEAFKADLASKGIYIKGSKADDNNFLLNLLTETQTKKSDAKGIDAAIARFETALKNNQAEVFESKEFDFNLGLFKKERRANYLRLLDSYDRVEKRKRYMGAPLFSTSRRKWLARKTFNLPNQTTSLQYNDKISTNLSPKNPVCELLKIKGSKIKARTPRVTTNSNTQQPILKPSPVPAFARTEDSPESDLSRVTQGDEQFQDLADSIADPTIKEDALELDVAGAKFQIEIQKNNVANHEKEMKMWLATIKMKISKMAVTGIKGKTTTLSLDDDDSLKVKITLQDKKGPKK